VAGSQIGTKDTKMKDVEFAMPTVPQPKQATTAIANTEN